MPPPAQAWATKEILNILQRLRTAMDAGADAWLRSGPANPEYWHLLVEAKKLAYADLYQYNADPDFATVPLRKFLSEKYAASLCGKVDPQHASTPGPSGEFFACRATPSCCRPPTGEGNMVSWVNSNFSDFGSGVTVPGYGFILHNRGALFTLNPKAPMSSSPTSGRSTRCPRAS